MTTKASNEPNVRLTPLFEELERLGSEIQSISLELSDGSVWSFSGHPVGEKLLTANGDYNYWKLTADGQILSECGLPDGQVPEISQHLGSVYSKVEGMFNHTYFIWISGVLIINELLADRDVSLTQALHLISR